ncbi:U32 family peptidase [Acidaminobacter hydrogenoformans]|uniref:Putative protease n=1 Tax=Acidaminobacter hydrogenoformans DSM 2784 TaxID=1120920 RepID=A0A1G5RU09_9FIRM|nr:U32 family peptidase [Acidaminobacter hydrogenoformans]SCZ77563.1 putative protease [Acidaminobacter hydrogenoformans DSM 2784]
MSKFELLAPAGSRASFEAAIKAGADAIYLGGDAFGARHSAANFDDAALREVVREAHLVGVRVYLTVNTLIYDHEKEGLTAFLDRMAAIGLDAWIVQDLGVLELVQSRYPQVEVHASTQMAAQNLEDVKALMALGVHRVVLPREMRLEEARAIYRETGAELELFVHGALCVSVSGQCYMSSMIGGRSGNRGQCAQSCRQAYDLIDLETGENVGGKSGMYRLSPKDLNTLEHIGEILESGVTALKIEGRMKGPEFVYQTVKAYRTAIDRHLKNEALSPEALLETEKNLEKIFNRGFTKGWVLGERGGDYLSADIPGNQGIPAAEVIRFDARAEEVEVELLEDLTVGDELQIRKGKESSGCRVEYILLRGQRIKSAEKGSKVRINYKSSCNKGDLLRRTYDKKEMDRIQGLIHETSRRIPVQVAATLKVGLPLEVCLTDAQGNRGCAVSELPAEAALKRPLDRERLLEQLGKLGTTIYEVSAFDLNLDGEATLPIKVINETRRLAGQRLDEARLEALEARGEIIEAVVHQPDEVSATEEVAKPEVTLCASVPDLGRLHLVLESGLKDVYFRGPVMELEQAKALAARYDAKLSWQWTRPNPSGLLEKYTTLLSSIKPEGIVVSSPGMLGWAKQFAEHVTADYGMNVLNTGSERVVRALGAEVVTLSPELTGEGIETIGKASGGVLEIVGYGHLPVMVTPHCPIRTGLGGPDKGCALCSGKSYGLRDKTGAIFPVVKTGPCWTEILNNPVLDLSDQLERLSAAGVTRYRLHFTIESPDEIMDLVAVHQERLEGKRTPVRSEYPRTHGHFFRGVF